MRIIFMGTPDFAVGTLRALHEAGHEIVLAVSQPDRTKGRGKAVSMPPVKECALELGIPVFQPEKVKTPEAVAELKKYDPDLMVVAAFGQILSKEILEMPKYGCINVHASLLPKYRGAAPIQWSIIDGEEYTGVTIMQMDEGLDTGDMITQAKVKIESDETGGSLFDKLASAGAELCVKTVKMIEDGTAVRTPQGEGSTYAKMLSKELGNIDFGKSAAEICRLVRALDPWPSAYSFLNGKMLKIWKAEPCEKEFSEENGTVVEVNKESFLVSCGSGSVKISELQLEGKKRMSVHDFLLGQKCEVGMKLDNKR
ncbi:methionyl-tRNA formyltransferase [Lachnospiraceae bacterium KH1T2]|nr:methionyl-tRNA formyltransferase [Lachnospiraceae bacterium KH1T2]